MRIISHLNVVVVKEVDEENLIISTAGYHIYEDI